MTLMRYTPSNLPAFAMRALAPHWGALLGLALFLIAGLAVLDDYGSQWDEHLQRSDAEATLSYLADGDFGAFNSRLLVDHDKFYGMAFEAPLLLIERAIGIDDDPRAVNLSRHLHSRLFFLAGGLFAYLLALRLFGSRPLALFAMGFLLLHPRLYGHSFFNSKDIPFLVMFVVALYLTHRALKRDTLPSFVLLGVGVGLLANLRIMGVVLLAAVPTLRALDFALASGWAERKRVLLTTGGFALAAALTVYALLPYLWPEPVGRAVEWWSTLSNHPHVEHQLFRGAWSLSVDAPAEYLPVWFSITAPPFALLLGSVGAGAILVAAARAPREAMGNGRLRFALLLVGCFALPVFTVMLPGGNIYNGWRQMFFLWAPFGLLTVFGIQWLVSTLGHTSLRTAAYGAATAGLAAAVISMALIHPNQQVYFSVLVDRVTPERLGTQYVMDYWRHPARQALERLLAESSSFPVKATMSSLRGMLGINARILPDADRERLVHAPGPDAVVFASGPAADEDLALHAVSVYGNTLISIARKPDLEAAYAAAASVEPIIRSGFDVHHIDSALVYVKEPCSAAEVTGSEFKLWVVPRDGADLPRKWEFFGHEYRRFHFLNLGAVADGKCVASVPLPDYPIAAVRTGQWLPGSHETGRREVLLWKSDAALNLGMWREARRGALSIEPRARAVFDLRLIDGALVYVKEPCEQADTEARFFLHITPERIDDLPDDRMRYGFDNLDFAFFLNGALFEGSCAARIPLPDYPISSIRTGQYVSGVGEIWSAEFEVGR